VDLIANKISFLVNLSFNWKKLKFGDWNWTLKSLIGQILGLIMKKIKFNSQLGAWLKKLKTMDQIVKYARLQGLKLIESWVKLKKNKSLIVN
jgi:hypothetical protein